jgi:hypothetical protein
MTVKNSGAKKPVLRKQLGKANSSIKSVVKTATKPAGKNQDKNRETDNKQTVSAIGAQV